jgi:hypothetical protein
MAITASWQHVISLITSLNMRFVVAGVPVVGCQYAQRCNCLNSRSQLKLIEIGAAGKAFAVAPSLFAAPNIVRIESDAEEIGWNETKLRSPDADQQMSALFAPAMIQRCHNCLPVNTVEITAKTQEIIQPKHGQGTAKLSALHGNTAGRSHTR